MISTTRMATSTLVCTALALTATACSSTTKPIGAATAASTPIATNATAIPATPSPTATLAGPLAGMAGGTIATNAEDAQSLATSVHVTGGEANAVPHTTVDVRIAGDKGCQGTATTAGAGSYQVVVIGSDIWVKPDLALWRTMGGGSPAAQQLLSGKYFKSSLSDTKMRLFAEVCSLNSIVVSSMQHAAISTVGPVTTFAGTKALTLLDPLDNATILVSDTAAPEVLQVTDSGAKAATTTFSDYNAPLTLTPPPADETVSAAEYGL
ncbi:hypothetical protein [Streptacidiphilus albus]|uniref:hypothetical protein n=1 Tax=Streptacidiphilus albus TaxID=105425 RepID=UPI00054B881C|nr:hypothetical protein [Streptacidiphilus albus]